MSGKSKSKEQVISAAERASQYASVMSYIMDGKEYRMIPLGIWEELITAIRRMNREPRRRKPKAPEDNQ